MNAKQAELILSQIDNLADQDERMRSYMLKVASKNEEFFVKNLENVQGDERDSIVISMTYGPQSVGAPMPQRFGEINRSHGGRRLNVLFSRARRGMTVFHSFGPDQVTLHQHSSTGLRTLKRFFEFALSKGQVAEVPLETKADSDFEIEVASGLTAAGYDVIPQVGVTGYRIDIGVRSKKNPGIFLAGIECDGATYHSSKSARDRDRLREQVLNSLGWRILRVWSTDWFHDPEGEIQKVLVKLNEWQDQENDPEPENSLPFGAQRVPAASHDDTQVEKYDEAAKIQDQQQVIILSPVETQANLEGETTSKSRAIEEMIYGTDPLTVDQARDLLETFRDTIIKEEMVNWEPRKSILRDGMIETFIARRMNDAEDWAKKVDQVLRSNTDGREKKKYLDAICDIIDRIHYD